MSPAFSLFTAGLAVLGPAVSALTVVGGSEPRGNSIHTPGLHDAVAVGKEYNITWEATTTVKGEECDCVDIVLLHGVSASTMQAIDKLAHKIDNQGSFEWTPSKGLAPTSHTGYGIEIICHSGSQYQYSPQFGITNRDYSSSTPGSHQTTTAIPNINSTTGCTPVGTAVPSSGNLPHNTTVLQPTGGITKPSSLATTYASTVAPITGATGTPQSGNNNNNNNNNNNTSGGGSSSSSNTPVAAGTGAASPSGASLAGVVLAVGVAVFAL